MRMYKCLNWENGNSIVMKNLRKYLNDSLGKLFLKFLSLDLNKILDGIETVFYNLKLSIRL